MNKRNRIRAGLSFGIPMTVFFILQNLLEQDNLTTKNIIHSIILGVFAGAVAGLLFAWLGGLFVKSKFVSEQTKIDLDEDESILFETSANHFTRIEAAGGKLYLTNKRLVFKSHNANIQNHQLSINISDIKRVDRYKTIWIFNNGLSVTTISGLTEKFVVQQSGKWIDDLTEKNGLQQLQLN
jgi:hypothetical protein